MNTFRLLVRSLAVLLVSTLSNWFYDLLKQWGVLSEKPAPNQIVVVLALVIPFLLFIEHLESQKAIAIESGGPKSWAKITGEAFGKASLGTFFGVLWWMVITRPGTEAFMGTASEAFHIREVVDRALALGSTASLVGGVVGGIVGAFGLIYFGKLDEVWIWLLDALFSKLFSNPFSVPLSKVVGGAMLGSLILSLLGLWLAMMFVPFWEMWMIFQ